MFLPPEALSVQADIPGSITLLNLIEAGAALGRRLWKII